MYRYCMIGSVILHILFFVWAGFCLPAFSRVKPAERYLQIYSEPDFEATAQRETDIREKKTPSAVKQSVSTVPKKPPVQTVGLHPVAAHKQKQENPPAPMKHDIATEPVKHAAVSEKAAPVPNIEAQESIKVSGTPKPKTLAVSNPGVPAGTVLSIEPVQSADIPARNGLVCPEPGPDLGAKNDDRSLPVPDVTSALVYAPQMGYPSKAKQNNWEGKVWVKALVGIDGKVKEATVLESSGYSILDASALENAKKRRYKPAQKGGEPVACFVEIPFTFKLEE
jgi:TonB family protein